MRAGSMLTIGVLAGAMAARQAGACTPVPATLGRGVCALESVPDGVRAHRCVVAADAERADVGASAWTIAVLPAATAVEGVAGGAFRGATVDVLVSDGAFLWLGVSERSGCGLRPGGLVRYDWKRDVSHAFRGSDTGPCGFLVQDLLLRGDTLWVATDLGISRLRVSPEDWDEWTHYALASDGAGLEETACGSLLAEVAQAAAAPGGEELGRRLAEFRPKFVKRLGARVRKYGVAPRAPRRPDREARRRRRTRAVRKGGATTRDGMHRRSNATVFPDQGTKRGMRSASAGVRRRP